MKRRLPLHPLHIATRAPADSRTIGRSGTMDVSVAEEQHVRRRNLRRGVTSGDDFLLPNVMFRRLQTRAASCVAPPKRHWYKDRAAIQATRKSPGDCGVSGHASAKIHARERAFFEGPCADSILFHAGRSFVRE
jgi:hypothetical protein